MAALRRSLLSASTPPRALQVLTATATATPIVTLAAVHCVAHVRHSIVSEG